MVGYKGHILIGLIFGGIFGFLNYKYNIFNLTLIEIISSIFVIIIYSILADIDIASSKIRHISQVVGLTIIIIAILFNLKLISLSLAIILLILQFAKHRKFIHSITAGIIFSLPLIYFSYIISIFAFIAYISHLIVDGKVKWR